MPQTIECDRGEIMPLLRTRNGEKDKQQSEKSGKLCATRDEKRWNERMGLRERIQFRIQKMRAHAVPQTVDNSEGHEQQQHPSAASAREKGSRRETRCSAAIVNSDEYNYIVSYTRSKRRFCASFAR